MLVTLVIDHVWKHVATSTKRPLWCDLRTMISGRQLHLCRRSYVKSNSTMLNEFDMFWPLLCGWFLSWTWIQISRGWQSDDTLVAELMSVWEVLIHEILHRRALCTDQFILLVTPTMTTGWVLLGDCLTPILIPILIAASRSLMELWRSLSSHCWRWDLTPFLTEP